MFYINLNICNRNLFCIHNSYVSLHELFLIEFYAKYWLYKVFEEIILKSLKSHFFWKTSIYQISFSKWKIIICNTSNLCFIYNVIYERFSLEQKSHSMLLLILQIFYLILVIHKSMDISIFISKFKWSLVYHLKNNCDMLKHSNNGWWRV
jgi:hypothetical protein